MHIVREDFEVSVSDIKTQFSNHDEYINKPTLNFD